MNEAFHLFIPYVVVYGYPWSRMGEIQVTVGTFLNIKTFSKPHADWSGETADNPFVLNLAPQKVQRISPEQDYLPETVKEFKDIASRARGKSIMTPGKEELIPEISNLLDQAPGKSLDLVLALDTTPSMEDEFPYLRRELVPLVRKFTARFARMRVGLLLYRDYFEQYLTKCFPFTDSLSSIQGSIDQARVHGGKDIPEAVF